MQTFNLSYEYQIICQKFECQEDSSNESLILPNEPIKDSENRNKINEFDYRFVKLEEDRNYNLLIYPNPTNGNFYIGNLALIGEISEVVIFDHPGQKVLHKQIFTETKIEIDFSDNNIVEGIYFVRLTTKSVKIYIEKVFKSK